MSEEQKVPTKEEIIAFLEEQISVKKVQLQLQEINTKLAVAKAEELKALSIIGNITSPPSTDKGQQPQGHPYTITQEDIDNNPELVKEGLKVGDEVLIPTGPQMEAAGDNEPITSKKLKK
jgi:hypothetical protein